MLVSSPSQLVPVLGHRRRHGFGTGAGGASFVGALDSYTAGMAGAWSVVRRMLASYAGSLLRVRRSSDNTETDIGYLANGNLDTAALLAFCGSGSGYATKIYDQSGLGRDFVQTSASAQRRIVNAGALDTQGGRPTLVTSSDLQGYYTATFTPYSGAMSGFARAMIAGGLSDARVLSVSTGTDVDYIKPAVAMITQRGSFAQLFSQFGIPEPIVSQTLGAPFTASFVFTGTTSTLTTNTASNSISDSTALGYNRFFLGMYQVAAPHSRTGDEWCEAIIYAADKTAAESAIRGILTP